MDILVVGINHRTAPVNIREKLAVSYEKLVVVGRRIIEKCAVYETVVLSTCNRVEIYALCDNVKLTLDGIKKFLAEYNTISLTAFEKNLYYYKMPESISHLFNVASGLDSMVIGETEIFGQLKKAYQHAHQHKLTGKVLNMLFQKTFNVAKYVRTHTHITKGNVSVSSIAVVLAKKIFGDLSDKTVMILGAGETSELTVKHLKDNGINSVIVSNRSFDKAEKLAEQFNGKAIRFDDYLSAIEDVDIVIGSTAAPRYIIEKNEILLIMPKRKQRPLFFIDIAVPRDIDEKVNDIDNVYLYNIDDLQVIAESNMKQRASAIEKSRDFIHKKTEEFIRWLAGIKGEREN